MRAALAQAATAEQTVRDPYVLLRQAWQAEQYAEWEREFATDAGQMASPVPAGLRGQR